MTSGKGFLTRGVAGWWVWVCVGGGVCVVCFWLRACGCGVGGSSGGSFGGVAGGMI